MRIALLATLVALASPAVADDVVQVDDAEPVPLYDGPDEVVVDLLRVGEGGPRIFVQADLGGERPLLFMVDTGADVNVLTEDLAEELELDVVPGIYRLSGLGGSTSAGEAIVDTVRIGDATLADVPFAVGVRGVGDMAGGMPVAGVIGMPVWRHFVLEIDYPADTLVLHRHGTVPRPRRADDLDVDQDRLQATIEVETRGDVRVSAPIKLQLDTGASALLIQGSLQGGLDEAATEGVEPIYGVGASEYMPPSQFLRTTRRIPVRRVRLGGRTQRVDINAQWMGFEGGPQRGPSTTGLIGHELLRRWRVWIDPREGWLLLDKSRRKKRQLDGHQVLYDEDVARFGEEAPERDLFRARLLAALDRWDEASVAMERYAKTLDDEEGRVLLARFRRADGDVAGAMEALGGLEPGVLVDEEEIVAAVNALALDDKTDQALALARRAVAARREEADAHIAMADALLAAGALPEARDTLHVAAELLQNPDALLLRRARVALARGDRVGALAMVRRMVHHFPTSGIFLWYYGMLVETEAEADTLELDVEAAVGRLHPDLRPLDFMVAAYHAIGDQDRAVALMHEGIERDCEGFRNKAGARNCEAWYHGLAGQRLDRALRLVDSALAETGPRSDYLDTRAVVLLARGDVTGAHEAALAAARLDPSDVYMLWQAERIAVLLGGTGSTSADARAEAAPATPPTVAGDDDER